ncbi:hypothetical protein [Streptococcus pneumoniae]|uniref:hypothetical protein n=1 Tax=Streptococcus pneumoniae TaxID=1313 RepID=UPI000B589C43|nr:hypothetical protein [Streptococcus pneumoniae]
MKTKEQTRKLASGAQNTVLRLWMELRHVFEVADRTDEVSSKHIFEVVDETDEVSNLWIELTKSVTVQ